jgi:hypothetical protein
MHFARIGFGLVVGFGHAGLALRGRALQLLGDDLARGLRGFGDALAGRIELLCDIGPRVFELPPLLL